MGTKGNFTSGEDSDGVLEYLWMVWAVGPGRLSEGGVWYLQGTYPTEKDAKAWARSKNLRTPVIMKAEPWKEKPLGEITWGKRKEKRKAKGDTC
jgi:hypothetical protein